MGWAHQPSHARAHLCLPVWQAPALTNAAAQRDSTIGQPDNVWQCLGAHHEAGAHSCGAAHASGLRAAGSAGSSSPCTASAPSRGAVHGTRGSLGAVGPELALQAGACSPGCRLRIGGTMLVRQPRHGMQGSLTRAISAGFILQVQRTRLLHAAARLIAARSMRKP